MNMVYYWKGDQLLLSITGIIGPDEGRAILKTITVRRALSSDVIIVEEFLNKDGVRDVHRLRWRQIGKEGYWGH
jgi:hypothetical protein